MNAFRLRLEIEFEKDAFFFEREYKTALSRYFEDIMKNRFFVFSDLIPLKKKTVTDGFWALKRAALIFCTPFQELLPKIALKIVKTPVDFYYGRLNFSRVIFLKLPIEKEGYLLSPVALSGSENLLWEKEPWYFSENLRRILIEKYRMIYGEDPSDDRFLFCFKGNPEEEELQPGIVSYRGRFEIFGSNELLKLSYLCGLGSFNEKGYGMASPDLYLWKKKTERGGSGGQCNISDREIGP